MKNLRLFLEEFMNQGKHRDHVNIILNHTLKEYRILAIGFTLPTFYRWIFEYDEIEIFHKDEFQKIKDGKKIIFVAGRLADKDSKFLKNGYKIKYKYPWQKRKSIEKKNNILFYEHEYG